MKPEEIIRRCDEQIEISGEKASVGFRIPGRWGKTDTRRLCGVLQEQINMVAAVVVGMQNFHLTGCRCRNLRR